MMQAFLDAGWLDELSALDALRLGAACTIAREALGADGVAAAAFAVTRPWTASGLPNPAGSLGLWRRAWAACSMASSTWQVRGAAWLEAATVIPEHWGEEDFHRGVGLSTNQERRAYEEARGPDVAVTLDLASARALADYGILLWSNRSPLPREVIAVLLISCKSATFLTRPLHTEIEDEDSTLYPPTCLAELHMLFLLADSQCGAAFGAAIVVPWTTCPLQLTRDPQDVCETVIADGFDTRLLAAKKRDPTFRSISVSFARLESAVKRVAPDGQAYDFFEFMDWYDGGILAKRRWREAPPSPEVLDERENGLEGMLTRSAQRILAAREALPLAGEERE